MVNRRTRLNAKNIDIDYCFLSDVGCEVFSDDSFSTNKKNKRFLNNMPYKDPDKYSLQLYKYHAFLWEYLDNDNKHCMRRKCNWNEITFTYNKEIFYLTSDYIGASIGWAIYKGISDKILNDYLNIARSIGGHILFWRHTDEKYACWCKNGDEYILVSKDDQIPYGYKKITINTARGGSGGVFDRFDWTLIMLKEYYNWGM